jgi:hypothetical protein
MTNQQHPITSPPFELINQWHKEACKDPYNGGAFIESKVLKYITTAAAQWGADQELEACCEWAKQFNYDDEYYQDKLRAARRPKPPSFKEQALEKLMNLEQGINPPSFNDYNTIRRALEQLND